jgi:RHS repeat-associated protein
LIPAIRGQFIPRKSGHSPPPLTGEGGSNYSYAGEWTDSTGLQYLRARYYNTGIGSFLTRDTWGGDYYDPLSLNHWAYVQGNPVNYVDPSGRYYNRANAVQYAMNWDNQAVIDPEYDFTYHAPEMDWSKQCTMFASSVLHYGGIRDTRSDPIKSGNPDYDVPYWSIDVLLDGGWEFNGYSKDQSWFGTNSFHGFVSTVVGSTVLTYSAPPHYRDNESYSLNAEDEAWLKVLRANSALIQEGDLVFYGSGPVDNPYWDHVAVIVGWGLPTTFGEKENLGIIESGTNPNNNENIWEDSLGCNSEMWLTFIYLPLRPSVVERSGYIDYHNWRSLDNGHDPKKLNQ